MPDDPKLPAHLKQPFLGTCCDQRKRESIATAAWILEDAVSGNRNPDEKYPTESHEQPKEAREFHIRVQRAEKLYEWALLGLVVLSFVEVPSWCRCHVAPWQFLSGADRCYAPDNAMIFLSGIAYFPTGYGVLVECTCMSIVLRKFLMQWEQERKFFKPIQARYGDYFEIWCGIIITCLGFVDCFVFFFFWSHTRIVLITRSGLLMMLPSVRQLAKIAFSVIVDVCSIMLFLLGTILMFAWVAVTLFHDYRIRNVEGVMIDDGFKSLPNAIYSMFLASVTEEAFIEKFLPTFTAFRVTGFLWLFFLVLVHLLLLNLVLDTLVAGYKRVTDEEIKRGSEEQAAGVLKSFAAVCNIGDDENGDPQLDRQGFQDLLEELGRSPYLRQVTPEISEEFFKAVDDDGSGMINQSEYIDICKVMNYEFWLTRYDSKFKDRHPRIWNSAAHGWFRKMYEQEYFDIFMNCVLVVNFGMIILESWYDLQDWDEPAILGTLELWFSLVYVVELLLKLSVISWSEFWSFSANKFDFWSTVILCLNSALSASPTLDNICHIDSRYANMLRVLRLLRVLKTVKRLEEVKFLTSTILKIVQLSREIMTLLGVIIFIFSQVSVQLFGGLLYVGNPALEGTEYQENNWFVINYNDLLMAFATYFVSLLVEFTPVLAEVLNAIAGWEWLISLFYYMTAVAVVFELVQAFTIETFVELYSRKGEEPEEIFQGFHRVEEEFNDPLQVSLKCAKSFNYVAEPKGCDEPLLATSNYPEKITLEYAFHRRNQASLKSQGTNKFVVAQKDGKLLANGGDLSKFEVDYPADHHATEHQNVFSFKGITKKTATIKGINVDTLVAGSGDAVLFVKEEEGRKTYLKTLADEEYVALQHEQIILCKKPKDEDKLEVDFHGLIFSLKGIHRKGHSLVAGDGEETRFVKEESGDKIYLKTQEDGEYLVESNGQIYLSGTEGEKLEADFHGFRRIHFLTLGGRTEKWEEELGKAFDELMDKAEEEKDKSEEDADEEKDNAVEADGFEHGREGSLSTPLKRVRKKSGDSADQAIPPNISAPAMPPEADHHKEEQGEHHEHVHYTNISLKDFDNVITHLTEDEVQILRGMEEKRKHRRTTCNPYATGPLGHTLPGHQHGADTHSHGVEVRVMDRQYTPR